MSTERSLTPRGWSDEEVEFVRAAIARGESAAAISKKMRGRSRNAVIGLAYRNGWTRTGLSGGLGLASKPRFTRAAPVRRTLTCCQHEGGAPITLAGPKWSHPGRAA